MNCTIHGRLVRERADGAEVLILRDEVRRRERQEGQHLDEQRRDQIVEQVLAPFVAQHRLIRVLREDALDRNEQRAGEQHVEEEEVEAEEDALDLDGAMRRQAADHGGEQRHRHRGAAERLVLAQDQAQRRERKARDQHEVDDDPERDVLVGGGELRHRRERRVAQRDHHQQADDAGEQPDRSRYPAGPERPRFARRVKLRADLAQEFHRVHGLSLKGRPGGRHS